VLTSLLLVLIVLGVAALIYPWATGVVSGVSAAFYGDVSALKETLGTFVEIYPPPAVIPAGEANYPVLIHNSGRYPLTGVRVYIIAPDSTDPVYIPTRKVSIDGNIEQTPTTEPKDLDRGESLIAYLPKDNNYVGYTIVVSGRRLLTPYTVVIG